MRKGQRFETFFFSPSEKLDIMITLDGAGRGGGGRVRGEGKEGCDETLITSSFLITHSYRSLQTKPLLLTNTSVTSCERKCQHMFCYFFTNGLSQYLQAFNI